MHAKMVEREKLLIDRNKVLESKIRDLRQRVFSKPNEKNGPKKGKASQPPRIPNDLVANNPAAKGTALQNDRICLRHKKVSSSRKIRYALSAENRISRMELTRIFTFGVQGRAGFPVPFGRITG
jgi:hypothetical protein